MSAQPKCPVCAEDWDDPSYPKCSQCRRDHKALVAAANAMYGSDDIGVDDDARLSRGEQGVWVQAWVFIPNEED